MDNIIPAFASGVQNLIDDEIIRPDAAQDELNWLTQDGRIKLMYGRIPVGDENLTPDDLGPTTGLWKGVDAFGNSVFFRKAGPAIQYLDVDSDTWTEIIDGLDPDIDYSFQNYSSLAGAFVIISGENHLFKINLGNVEAYKDMYDAAINDAGDILIDKGRMFMWNCRNAAKTTLKLSHIDPQDSRVYTQVTGESIGSSGMTTYSGTLSAISGTRNSFGLVFYGTVAAGSETFTDNGDGTLTSDRGGTGTIEYLTGSYSITFSDVTTGAVTTDYLWEDSNTNGITDFTYSTPDRDPSEGAIVPQTEGGDPILKVEIGQDGNYYSGKKQSFYRLIISADDTTIDNNVYRRDIGLASKHASVSTSKGIIFVNTANPDKPELTILQRNAVGDNIEPVNLFPQFKFSKFDYSDAFLSTAERYIVLSCKTPSNEVNNRILMLDTLQNSVDISGYNARQFMKDQGNLFVADPITHNVYKIFNGFDDNGLSLNNYWISRGDKYVNLKNSSTTNIGERLKKFRRLRIQGLIGIDQNVEVYVDFDNAGFQLAGTISGQGGYVDYANAQEIGDNMIGDVQIGGDDPAVAYPYFWEMKVKCPKFRKRTIKFVAKNIGYFDVQMMTDWDLLFFEARIPKRFRQKQHVSLTGETDQDNFSN